MASLPIPVSVCERLVEAASRPCPLPVAVPPTLAAPHPEWDALATSLSGIGLAVAWGGTVLAITALIAGIAWAKLLRGIARKEARECAEEMMAAWLANEAPQYVSSVSASITDASTGDTDDAQAAEDIGREA